MPRKIRDYKAEYRYHSTPEQLKNRAMRNAARRAYIKANGTTSVRGKDVDHKKAISKGGTNKPSNLRAISPSKNRSYARTKKGRMR